MVIKKIVETLSIIPGIVLVRVASLPEHFITPIFIIPPDG
jgi:hypothetical protein